MVQDNVVLLRPSARNAAKPQAGGKWLREGPDSKPRAFPVAATPPTLPSRMSDDLLDFYAFIFCQGGFRQTGMTFEQFLLVVTALGPNDLYGS
jgi:hypothetical protein